MTNRKEITARYRDNNREKLRSDSADYQRRIRGTPEGLARAKQHQKSYRKKLKEKFLRGENVVNLFAIKKCPGCNLEKQLSEFHKNPSRHDGVSPHCKECGRIHRRDYHKKYPHKQHQSQLKVKFGLLPEDYNRMFCEQEGRCKCCHRHQSQFNRRLSVDHCHKTGKIRGLLCKDCNHALGFSRDNISTLENMIKYLQEAAE